MHVYSNALSKSDMDPPSDGLRFTDTFLQLFCEKNSDGTKKLRFKGNELQQRFQCRLFPADLVHICDFLKNHPEITDLDLSYNDIENEGFETLCHITLKHPNSLEHLNVTHCDISYLGIKTFFYVAQEGFIHLKTLRLVGNKIGPRGGLKMALALPFLRQLEYLDLGETDQTVSSLEDIFQKAHSLKVLNVSRPVPTNSLQVLNDAFLAESSSELFRLNNSLVEFHAQKCNLDAHDIEILIFGLKQNTSLRFLDLANNHIACMGTELIGNWLKTRPNLLALNISRNGIRNHGAESLCFGLVFSKIRYLDISHNKIGDEGMTSILNTCKKPYQLRYLLIWGNPFGERTNKVLQILMLAKVFEQERVDVKVFEVDGVVKIARFPVDKYQHRYYNVMDHGIATELKIKRNKIVDQNAQPRALVDFKHIDRYPAIK